MATNRDARLLVAWRLIESDLAFATRFVSSGQRHEKVSWLAAFVMLPHLGMICYELVRFLRKQHPEVADLLSTETLDIIRTVRNAAKHLDDSRENATSVAEAEKHFEETVISEYRAEFAPPDNWLGRTLRRLYKDLGVYYYSGQIVATTHSAAYTLGVSPTELNSPETQELLDKVYIEMGKLLNTLGHGLDPSAISFLDSMNSSQLISKEVHSSEFYAATEGSTDESIGLHALVRGFQSSLNFLNAAAPIDSDPSSIIPLTRMRLVTCTHVALSSERILETRGDAIGFDTRAMLESIVTGEEVDALLGPQVQRIRNVLVHYMPNKDFGRSDLRDEKPLLGIVEKYAPGFDFVDLAVTTYRETERMAAALNAWRAV